MKIVNMRTRGVFVLLQSMQVVVSLVNLSVNKPANMSSSQYDKKWLADKAVDGDVSQNVQDNSCAVTEYMFTIEAWWRVDLGDIYVINSVRIYNRRENPSVTYKLSGFSLYVSVASNWQNGALCYLDNNGVQSNPGPSDVLTVPCNATGRYVTLHKRRECVNPYQPQYCAQLELCEVQVFGCEDGTCGPSCENRCTGCTDGTYGASCQHRCSGNCLNGETCNKAHGGCDNGCAAGYYGFRCDQACSSGVLDVECSSQCSPKCFNRSCNLIDGSCRHGCIAGWKGLHCNKTCEDGEFGSGCSGKCSEHCFEGLCDVIYGTCRFGCIDGWTGDQCNEALFAGSDTPTSINNSNTIFIMLIVTNILTIIALVAAMSLLCCYVRDAKNKKPSPNNRQVSRNGARIPVNRRRRETDYQPGTRNGITKNYVNTTYEEMNFTDTNTYETIPMERNVTYINTELI